MFSKRSTFLALGLLCVLVAGCGTQNVPGRGYVIVEGIAPNQEFLCGAAGQVVSIVGSGFQSEHADGIVVRYTAVEGTPFDAGTSAFEEVSGTVISDSQLDVPLPSVNLGEVAVRIRVTLAGGNWGESPPVDILLGGELVGPFALPDVYDAIGNVTLTVDPADGVLVNDAERYCGAPSGDDDDGSEMYPEPEKPAPGAPDTRQDLLNIVDFDGLTALGGTVALDAEGGFVYEPPLGVGGDEFTPVIDSFTYTIEQDGSESTTIVELRVFEVVWFIDDGVPPGGTGRLSDPFFSLNEFNAVQGGGNDDQPEPGDWIFVYEGSEPYDGGVTLLDRQKLIGQGVDLVVQSTTVVPMSGPPALTNTGEGFVDCIVLANANRIEGLTVYQPFGNAIAGYDVMGPTTVDHVAIMNPAQNGVLLDGECTGSFDFGLNVSVTDAEDTGVLIRGRFGGTQPSPLLHAQVFEGSFTYEGTISQTDAGGAIVVGNTSPGSSVVFQNGTIDYDGEAWAAIELSGVEGSFTCTSPQTLLGAPVSGIFAFDSIGTFTFADTTIDIGPQADEAGHGVWLEDVGGGTFTFTDLDITVAGDVEMEGDRGGYGILTFNYDEMYPESTKFATGTTSLTVDGNSSIDMTYSGSACLISGEGASPFDLDMTFQTIDVEDSSDDGVFLENCLGTFEVTGATTVELCVNVGISVGASDVDCTFDTVDLSYIAPFNEGLPAVLHWGSTGSLVIDGGTIDNCNEGVIVDGSSATLNGIAFSDLGIVMRLIGNVVLGGSGNTATNFGTLCETGALGTNTGSVSFTTPAMTCP